MVASQNNSNVGRKLRDALARDVRKHGP
jgi:hypothetical protein